MYGYFCTAAIAAELCLGEGLSEGEEGVLGVLLFLSEGLPPLVF